MLLQSHNGVIKILPALPVAWATGSIRGLRARGGFEVDIAWKNGKLSKAVLHSEYNGSCKLSYAGKTLIVNVKAGKSIRIVEQMFH